MKRKASNEEYQTNLALFLATKKGSIFGWWKGTLTAKEQRAMFGQFLGKGRIIIDGEEETIRHVKTVGFGMDYEVTANIRWRDL